MSTEPEKLPELQPVEPEAAEAPAVEPEAPTPTAPEVSEPVEPEGRVETFDAVRPDGKTVTITRNIDTGEQSAKVHE